MSTKNRDLSHAMDDFFERAGLSDIVNEMSKVFTDTFMVQGEPVEELAEALRQAPDGLIELIWERVNDPKEEKDLDRKSKEKILYQRIPEDLERRLPYLEPKQLLLLVKVMNHYPVEVMETADIRSDFVPWGWVFCFTDTKSCQFAVMKELRAKIMEIVERPEKQEVFEQANIARGIIRTCIDLYGVCTKEQIWDMIRMAIPREELSDSRMQEMKDEITEMFPIFERQRLFWQDGNYMVSPWLEDREDYKTLLKKQRGKMYYIPDLDVIQAYIDDTVPKRIQGEDEVCRCLTREIKDVGEAENMVRELAGYVQREDWGIPQIMNGLYEWDVAFDNKRTAARLVAALCEWVYSIPRWSECGYSRKELKLENEEERYLMQTGKPKIEKAPAKIYPNDPCPCGSGKKYKKCCGR